MYYSFIIPLYNRPDEIDELLDSLTNQTYKGDFEVVVVEDGSAIDSRDIVAKYEDRLSVSYYYKENSGPGDSRNYGMQRAKGDYFIVLDSDCIIPSQYLTIVDQYLNHKFVDCFGGPDAALDSFTDVQKAINFAMTSFMTTGGIRGGSERVGKFQPRSFNMGISKKAFEASGGYGKIHPGEDPDLTIRLWELGFETELFPKAYVYHKRRIDWKKFYTQVNKFGKARPILNKRYPKYSKLTYWFPSVFILGLLMSLIGILFENYYLFCLYILYFLLVFMTSAIKERSLKIGFLSILSVFIQFFGYGTGFVKATYRIVVLNRKPEEALPEMFFK
ncbi:MULTISPECIES: glycosyltransferase [Myroides]|uniref:Glycosyltransferase n=1 Tax=Myroides albus TaxID=2562892 RepID=A0A6I3LE97_9FLAO|nr:MULTISPECIES: glycosyltransferase [Myroides]MTG97779.1 glycosyltransferase [Myroides albus]MVX35537.1 glycosyltransferase [Myroides sp. LoEW2-1]UVD79735.1 glycosyltransferase [Myroides albus]